MLSQKEQVAVVSIIASGSLAAVKFTVGVLIGSLALISDAIHSLIDFAATVVTLIAVRVADRPADAEHHYGHGKAESLSALAVTALLFVLAGGIVVEAWGRLAEGGAPVAFSPIAFAVLAGEIGINYWRARVLKKTAEETRSQALEADSLHFASDLYGSVAVIIGLIFSAIGMHWADSAAAMAVAVMISVLGLRLGKQTIETLMDRAPHGVAEDAEKALRGIRGIVDVERVRVRTVGPHHFVEVTAKVPRTMPIGRLEQVKRQVEEKLAATIDNADVTFTPVAVAVDNEKLRDAVMFHARTLGLAIHHVTVHDVGDRLSVAVDLEVDGALPLSQARAVAQRLEQSIQAELGTDLEFDTHIEPLQPDRVSGHDAPRDVIIAIERELARLAAEFGALRDIHDVRVRETAAGQVVHFHCRADSAMTVAQVHDRVDEVERGLRQKFPRITRIIGHPEPPESAAGAAAANP